jgi:hypothetical protein
LGCELINRKLIYNEKAAQMSGFFFSQHSAAGNEPNQPNQPILSINQKSISKDLKILSTN